MYLSFTSNALTIATNDPIITGMRHMNQEPSKSSSALAERRKAVAIRRRLHCIDCKRKDLKPGGGTTSLCCRANSFRFSQVLGALTTVQQQKRHSRISHGTITTNHGHSTLPSAFRARRTSNVTKRVWKRQLVHRTVLAIAFRSAYSWRMASSQLALSSSGGAARTAARTKINRAA